MTEQGSTEGTAPAVDLGIPSVGPAHEIGRGAAGVVYKAEQPAFNRTVAVKLLPFAALDEAARARFERECRAMGSVSGHPGIVTVYEAGFTPSGQPYILMELMDGGSLEQRLALRGPFQWEEVVEIGVRLAAALEIAHRKGILHRDIKPDNVLVSTYGDAKLADFSIARLAGATKTATGLVAATPAHAPPEVLRGEDPSVRGDVYSLASTLWTLLAGAPAFLRPNETTIFALLRRVEEDPVPDLRVTGAPDPICRVLERSMAKDPMQRPPSANAFGAELLAARDQARAWNAAGVPTIIGQPSTFGYAPGVRTGPPQRPPTMRPPQPPPQPIGPPGAPPPVMRPPAPPPGVMSPAPGGGWPAPAARPSGPPRQLLLVGGGILAAAAALAVVLILLFGRSSSAGPAPSTSTGVNAGLDGCLVGSFRSTGVSGRVSTGGLTANLSGGDGELLTVRPDGSFTDDYNGAKPVLGDTGSVSFDVTTTGVVTGHVTATDGKLSETIDDANALTQSVSVAGVTQTSSHPPSSASGTYSCANGGFSLTAPDGTVTTFAPIAT